MSSFRSKSVPLFIRFSLPLTLICLICFLVGTICVNAERIPTTITIGILPKEPTINQSFHVIGLLKTVDGQPLGNKRIILESSLKGSQDIEDFSFLDIKETTRDGGYEFFRPKVSPPEFIRVRFAGNTEYEPSMSQVIAVRGAGTDHPQIRTERLGSVMVLTDPGGADIYIDNVTHGVSPNTVAGLSKGPHTIILTKSGYQNETMEAYVSSERDVSFDISLNPEGLRLASTDPLSTADYYQNNALPLGKPDFSLAMSGISMKLYGNKTPTSKQSLVTTTTHTNNSRNLKVSTSVMNNTLLGNGYDVMAVMTYH